MANNDKIYEAYIGKLGKDSEEKTKKRINWILNCVGKDKNILDIGCSQGIISILMAEKGNTVYGIDIQKEAVDFAQKLLDEKYSEFKNNVKYECADFFEAEFKKKFDVIVVTEVLEHLENPEEFVERTKNFISDNGTLVVSVPFGVSDHPDHKSTFYLTGIADILEKYYSIEKIEFMQRWVGFVLKNKEAASKKVYDKQLLKREEDNFYSIDRYMTDRVNELYSKFMESSRKYKDANENYAVLKNKYSDAVESGRQLNERNTEFSEKYKQSCENYEKMKELYINSQSNAEKNLKEYELYKEKYEKLSNTIKELYGNIDDNIEALKQSKALISKLESQNNYLKHENSEYRRKIAMITDTFIGKIGIKGYRVLKKIKNKLH